MSQMYLCISCPAPKRAFSPTSLTTSIVERHLMNKIRLLEVLIATGLLLPFQWTVLKHALKNKNIKTTCIALFNSNIRFILFYPLC